MSPLNRSCLENGSQKVMLEAARDHLGNPEQGIKVRDRFQNPRGPKHLSLARGNLVLGMPMTWCFTSGNLGTRKLEVSLKQGDKPTEWHSQSSKSCKLFAGPTATDKQRQQSRTRKFEGLESQNLGDSETPGCFTPRSKKHKQSQPAKVISYLSQRALAKRGRKPKSTAAFVCAR